MAIIDFLLVGRKPLGSALRAVIITILLWQFWRLMIVEPWTLLLVSLITSLAVVIASHLMSARDNASPP